MKLLSPTVDWDYDDGGSRYKSPLQTADSIHMQREEARMKTLNRCANTKIPYFIFEINQLQLQLPSLKLHLTVRFSPVKQSAQKTRRAALRCCIWRFCTNPSSKCWDISQDKSKLTEITKVRRLHPLWIINVRTKKQYEDHIELLKLKITPGYFFPDN